MTSEPMAEKVDDEPELERFRPLGEYAWPSASIDRGLKRFVQTFRKRFGTDEDEEGIDLSRLAATERSVLDDLVAPPANEPLMAELDTTLAEWRATTRGADAEPMANLRTIVLPPCDDENFLRSWAGARGLDVLEPPARDAFDRPADLPPGTCDGTGVLVVPRLEDWFLRHDTDLVAVRDLIRRIGDSKREWLVGCNSWAWQFLVRSCAVNAVLPEPLVPAAFDAARLRSWLRRLSRESGEDTVRFLSTRSGRNAFSDEADEGSDVPNTMNELAERSLGIPWVAWNQWRASLRTSDEREADERETDERETDERDGGAGGDERQTLWVAELRDFALPDKSDQGALLVLHALLVHGRLTEDEILRIVPVARHANVPSALVNAGMVRREDGCYVCVPAAYPAIRDGLSVAGYPMDVL